MNTRQVRNLISGEWVAGSLSDRVGIEDPASEREIAWFAPSSDDDVDDAVAAGVEAFQGWRDTPVTRRAGILFNLRQLLLENEQEIARLIVLENGKTLSEASGEMNRALEYVEHACAAPELMKSSFSENVGRTVDTHYIREPLGVFAIVAPFNFPAMIPLYFAWAVAAGNSVVVKPSELCPLTTVRIMELAQEAGFPAGVVNMILGTKTSVERLIAHPDVAGVSFVGSSAVAESIYVTASSTGKPAQCQGGSKNHLVITDSARLEDCMDNIINSTFGNASQRCFAGSNLLIYKSVYREFREAYLRRAKNIRLGSGMDSGVTMGPVITAEALEGFHATIATATDTGAKVLLDGRSRNGQEFDGGHFLGPTVIEADLGDDVFEAEVFGPIRCLKAVEDLHEAASIVNASKYGHTAAIYTEMGGIARQFARLVDTGQVGINVGTPAPIAFYPVGGRKTSFYGALRGRANDAIDFYTDKKVVVSRWHASSGSDPSIW